MPRARAAMRRHAGDVLAGIADACRSLGARKPEIRANNVVLPAPFGPIRPVMRPACDGERGGVDGDEAAEALADAARPPAGAQLMRASCAARRDRAKPPRCEQAPQPARREGDDQHQQRAIERRSRPGASPATYLAPSPSALQPPSAPISGPNTVPTPPMIGASSASIEIQVP